MTECDWFVNQVTLGEAIQIGLAFGAVVLGGLAFLGRLWWLNHPFYMLFEWSPFNLDRMQRRVECREFVDYWLSPRQYEMLLRIMPHRGIRIDRINLRFVQKEWTTAWCKWWIIPRPRIWEWKDLPDSIIHIDSVRDMHVSNEMCPSTQRFESWSDLAGGVWAEYVPPYTRGPEDSLWLCVKVIANKPGNYYLSFRGQIEDGRRGHCRRHVCMYAGRPNNPRYK